MIKEITVEQLKQMMDNDESYQLIDVREPYEYESANLNGILIPLASILDHVSSIEKDKKVIIHCKSGVRSANAVQLLELYHQFDNLYNLKGGIIAWSASYKPEISHLI